MSSRPDHPVQDSMDTQGTPCHLALSQLTGVRAIAKAVLHWQALCSLCGHMTPASEKRHGIQARTQGRTARVSILLWYSIHSRGPHTCAKVGWLCCPASSLRRRGRETSLVRRCPSRLRGRSPLLSHRYSAAARRGVRALATMDVMTMRLGCCRRSHV